jgi:methionine synthase II (cobalamin-independent)
MSYFATFLLKKNAITQQEAFGLQSFTDGEFRRVFWNNFLGKLDDVEAYLGERKIKFHGPQPQKGPSFDA